MGDSEDDCKRQAHQQHSALMCREALDWEVANNEWIEECSTGITCSFESLLNHHRDVGDGIFNTAEANECFAGTAQCNNDDNDEFENFGMRGEEAEDALKNNGITQVENINRAALTYRTPLRPLSPARIPAAY